ncbi:chondroitinase-AC-like [Homarus americanus]|uniref:chondroitinase-AC-like n=1 Tax=Homarus americanus TaxID=6706 RepID=UPI001C4452E2|nr:chondroitinase-AC-like [Homarus americanus]
MKRFHLGAPLSCLFFIIRVSVALRTDTGEVDDVYKVVMGRVHHSALDWVSKESTSSLLAKLQSDGSFSDLHYGEDKSTSFMTHGLRQGALMYHHLNGEDLAEEVLSCFTYITYDAPANTDTNWWGQVIGTPYRMWEGVVLARDLLPEDLLLDFLNRYWVNTLYGPVWNLKQKNENMAGGNLAPRAMCAEVEALLRGEYVDVHAQVTEQLYRELAQRQGWNNAGLRPDGCLHQHNMEPHFTQHGHLDHILGNLYNGHYGYELLFYDSLIVWWYSGTELDFDDATVEGMFSAYLECQQWLFRGHTIDPTTTGRFIDSGSAVTKFGTRTGVRDTGHILQKVGRHQQEVAAVLHRYDNPIPDPEYALSGNKYFFNSDLTVHQQREYMASVRVLSNRTTRQETWTSGQNVDGYFQGDGFMTVLVDGNEYGHENAEVFPVYDWAKVPGVTNVYNTTIPKFSFGSYWSEQFFNNAKFVGGATDGSIGVTSMVYQRPHLPLTYLKSWFFFEDVIFVMASDITLPACNNAIDNDAVITTLTQGAFEGEYVLGTEGGKEEKLGMGHHQEDSPAWLHHRDVGYVFLHDQQHPLFTSALTHTHKNKDLNVFTAWLDHGFSPQSGLLTYAVLPASNLTKTRAFAADPDVEVISQTSDLHVVCHHPSKTVGAVMVSGGQVTVGMCGQVGPLDLQVDAPCILLLTITSHTADATQLDVTLADPQQEYDDITIKMSVDDRQVEHKILLPSPPHRGSSTTTSLTV